MSNRAGFQRSYQTQFILEEQNLRKIVEVFQRYQDKLTERTHIKFHIHREDNSYFETYEIDEVLAEENCRGKKITHLSIALLYNRNPSVGDLQAAHNEERGIAHVSFQNEKTKYDSVRISIEEKSREWCCLFADDLQLQVDRIIKKNVLRKILSHKLVDMVIALLLLILPGPFLVRKYALPKMAPEAVSQIDTEGLIRYLAQRAAWQDSISTIPFVLMFVWMILTLLLMEAKPISRLAGAAFKSVFYWGDMVAEYDRTVRRANTIFWGVVVAFLVAIAAGIVLERIPVLLRTRVG